MLNKKLPTFLINKDDSIENLNEFIADSVKSAGLFTNEGVVTAGLSLINYLYYNYKVQIPYISNVNCFSTRYNILFGVNPDIGKKIDDKLIESQSDKCKGSYGGFDCASFVGWAIHNGGFQSNYTSAGYASKGNGKIINICDVEDSELPKNKECPLMKPKSEAFSAYNKIVPGDLLQSAGHVIMVLHNDTKSKKMYIYEGTTPVGIDTLTYDDIYSKWKYYKLVQMAGYYKNPSNYACLSLSKRGVVARDTFPQSWQDVIDKFSSSSCFYKND